MIHKSGKSVIGVDSSSYAIRTAKEIYPECKYEVGDLRTWVPATEVDMVLMTGGYYHLPKEERPAVLQHVKSYLKKDGALLVLYGCNVCLNSSRVDAYPNIIADEIFSVFKKQQHIIIKVTDQQGSKDASWNFYVGQK
jgi:2-polyprenyl-3-methyl-5-hydroxy-6-metoxy-1,4-benzoquinol methylase